MKIPTLINSSSKINGELIFTTDVRIDGEVFGKVESDKNVIVGAEGFVKGFLRAKDLVVFGRIEGNIIVSGITILHEKASIFGNLYTKVFEVKDGATITAKVVTYEKLEAIDEAQIYLAEEMIKVEPNRKQISNYSPAQTLQDTIDFVREDQSDSPEFSLKKSLWEQMPGNSADIISKFSGEKVENTAPVSLKKDPVIIEEDSISEFQPELLSQIVGFQDSIQHQAEISVTLPIEIVQVKVSEISPAGIDHIIDIKSVETELLFETEYQDSIEMIELEEDDKFNFLVSELQMVENNNQEIVIAAANFTDHDKESLLLEFDFEDNLIETRDQEEELLFPLPAAISIAGNLGEPIKVDSSKIKKGRKKPYSSDLTLITPNSRKGKNYNISGFEELRNLLSPGRFHDTKAIENKNDQQKYNSKKINDNDLVNTNKEIEKSEFFLNDAIRQLPIDDYSSLFN